MSRKHKKRAGKRTKRPKSKRTRQSPKSRKQADRGVPELENWCSNLCAAENVLKECLLPLAKVLDEALKRGRINVTEVRAAPLQSLSSRLEAVGCRFLDGLAIDILKKAAFIDGSDKNRFSWECYGLINSIWYRRRTEQIERAECYDQCRQDRDNPPCNEEQRLATVFDTERLLENWTSQLRHVKPKSLWPYIHVLVCEGLAEDPRFGEAVAGLKSHIVERVLPAHPREAATAGQAFVVGVLASMLDNDMSAVVRHLPDAAEIVACTVLSDDASPASVDALKELTKLATQLRSALTRKTEVADGREGNESLLATYELLRERCAGLSTTLKRRVGKHLESLMPSLCLRKTRSPRKRALKGTELRLDIAENGRIWQLSGQVIDFCSRNGAAHVHFDALEGCVAIRDNKHMVPGTDLETVPLLVTHKDCGEKLVKELSGHLRIPLEGRSKQRDIIGCCAWPLRGWRSITPEQGCRAVFLLKGAEDKIAELTKSLPTVLYHESTAKESVYAPEREWGEAEELRSPDAEGTATGSTDGCWMVKTGEGWDVCFEGKQTFVKHSVGIAYIAKLLHMPGTQVHAAELRSLEKRESVSPRLGSAGARIDEDAMKAYKARLEEIQDELRKAELNNDQGQIEKLQRDRRTLADEIKGASGLGGRIRKDSDDVKRAVDAVSRAIVRALDSIKKHHERLWCHLTDSIHTGEFLSYAPAKPVAWSVRWD